MSKPGIRSKSTCMSKVRLSLMLSSMQETLPGVTCTQVRHMALKIQNQMPRSQLCMCNGTCTKHVQKKIVYATQSWALFVTL